MKLEKKKVSCLARVGEVKRQCFFKKKKIVKRRMKLKKKKKKVSCLARVRG